MGPKHMQVSRVQCRTSLTLPKKEQLPNLEKQKVGTEGLYGETERGAEAGEQPEQAVREAEGDELSEEVVCGAEKNLHRGEGPEPGTASLQAGHEQGPEGCLGSKATEANEPRGSGASTIGEGLVTC